MNEAGDGEACVRRMALYCPSLSHECEERAAECVLYYYPPHESSDAQLNFVGFCTAVHLITSRFTTTKETSSSSATHECLTVGRSGGVVCMYEVRPDLWLALELHGTTRATKAHTLLRVIDSLGTLLHGETLWKACRTEGTVEYPSTHLSDTEQTHEAKRGDVTEEEPRRHTSSTLQQPPQPSTSVHKLCNFLNDMLRFITRYVLRDTSIARRNASSHITLSPAWAHITCAEAELGYACPLSPRVEGKSELLHLSCLQCLTRHSATLECEVQLLTEGEKELVRSIYPWQALCAAQDPVQLLDTASLQCSNGRDDACTMKALCAVLEAETLACVASTMPLAVLALQRLGLLVFGLRDLYTCHMEDCVYDCVLRRTAQVIALVLVPRIEPSVKDMRHVNAATACAQRIAQDITQLLYHPPHNTVSTSRSIDRSCSNGRLQSNALVCHSEFKRQHTRYGKYAAVVRQVCWLAWCASQGQVRQSVTCASDSHTAQELHIMLASCSCATGQPCGKHQTWVYNGEGRYGWLCMTHAAQSTCEAWSFAVAFPAELPLSLCWAYAADLARMLAW